MSGLFMFKTPDISEQWAGETDTAGEPAPPRRLHHRGKGPMIHQTPLVLLPLLLTLTVGDGKVQPGEQCDDGNTQDGDGCSSTGTLETGFLCRLPGLPCSLASLCGNGVLNSGEACDDGNTADSGNGCTGACDLSKCGDGAIDNLTYPSFAQEVCDDGNRFDGDGCSRLCEIEPGSACAGAPSRCVHSGVALFNTGVDASRYRVVSGPDPHWFYTGTTTGAVLAGRSASDWPQELQTARFLERQGSATCVYQDFLIPPSITVPAFRLRMAFFNDNFFLKASVNGAVVAPTIISQPPGAPWQKNIVREIGPTAPWVTGLNRIELCNDNSGLPPDASRYLFVDAYDDLCGDGLISPREECDDGNTAPGDGCNATCGLEAGAGCYGQPSICHPGCGDGALGEGEQCDDGNNTAGDGCGVHCTQEPGYSCTGVPSLCTVGCGDGLKATAEACDDGSTSDGDGCSAACTIEAGFSCQTAPVSVFFTRRGLTDCTQITRFDSPNLPAAAAQASLSVPGRYRIQYVSGAIGFDWGINWFPGIIGVNYTSAAGPGAFSLGFHPPAAPAPTREAAMSLGFGLMRDFEAASGDVRLAAIDDDCQLGNNTDTALTYRVDALPICQLLPLMTHTPENGGPASVFSGSSSPGATVQVYVDGSPTPVCTATAGMSGQWTCAAPGLTDGPHSAAATATVLGSTAASVPVSFPVDAVAPVAPSLTAPTPRGLVNATPEMGGLAEPGSLITVYEDSTILCTVTAGARGAWSCTPSQPFTSGPHAMVATSTDAVANVSQPSAWRSFTVDAEAPAAPALEEPHSGQALATHVPSLSGTAEPGSTVSVYMDGEMASAACMAVAAENGTWSCAVSAALAEGTHSFTASAQDAVGNTSQGASTTPFTVDTQTPDTSITLGPPALALSTDSHFEFSSNEPVVSYECSLDEESFAPCPDGYSLLALGAHTLRVRAVDAAGNTDPSPAEYTWTVRPPHLSGGGCSSAPGPALWLAVLGLAALGRLRAFSWRRVCSTIRAPPCCARLFLAANPHEVRESRRVGGGRLPPAR
jgi:cysteine-rich repeat protein